MKPIKSIQKLFFVAALVLGFGVTQASAAEPLKATDPNVLVMQVNGIVCPACAQGIIMKVSKLGFIDQDTFESGVKLDVENQRAYIATKPGSTPDLKALFEAVRKGGFDPVSVAMLKSGKSVVLTAAQVAKE